MQVYRRQLHKEALFKSVIRIQSRLKLNRRIVDSAPTSRRFKKQDTEDLFRLDLPEDVDFIPTDPTIKDDVLFQLLNW